MTSDPTIHDLQAMIHDLQTIRRRVQRFTDELARQEVHVGMNTRRRGTVCVTCHQPWPCPSAGPTPEKEPS